MVTGRSHVIEITAVKRHETELAVLLDCGGDEPVWFPKSVVEDCGDGTWLVPEDLALVKGVI